MSFMEGLTLLLDLLPPLDWSRPAVLYGLVVIPVFLVLQRFAFRQRPSLPSLVLRGLFLAALVLAAAGPATRGKQRPIPPILVIDVSDSLTATQRQWMQQTITDHIRPAPDTPVVLFGGRNRRLAWQAVPPLLVTPPPGVQPEETNMEAALGQLLEEPRPRAVYVLSDGWETQGTATALLSALAQRGLRLYPLPPPPAERAPNIALRRLGAPQSASAGEDIDIAIALENTALQPVRGELTLRERETVVWRQETELRPGASLLTHALRLSGSGLVPLHVIFVPQPEAPDAIPYDNQATAWVQIAPRSSVLLLSATPRDNRYLEQALTSRGLAVTALALPAPPAALPALNTFSAVILNNIAHRQLPAAFARGMDAYVKNGGGLIMVGGESSLGLGHYAGTAIEKVLPVRLVPPQKEEQRTAMLLIIDKSGSMRKQRKLLYAKLGARAVARNLRDTDLFGIIGFDKTPFVVAPLDYLGKTRAQLDDRIERLKPSGGTFLLPALQEAKRQLERQYATRKHIVLLTDGETGGSGSDYLDLAAVLRNQLKITISTIAVGKRPNLRLLSRLADYGGGAFYHTTDPSTLPDLFLDELEEKPEEKTMVERLLDPIPNPRSPLLKGLAQQRLPAVKGYVQTRLKKGARADLSVRDADKQLPLLASWSYGQGRAAAFTSDANGRWSAAWVGWERYGQFWNQTVRWSFAREEGDEPNGQHTAPFSVEVGHTETGLLVEAFFYGTKEAGQPEATLTAPDGMTRRLLFERVAAGHYQGKYDTRLAGDYTLEGSLPGGERFGPLGYTLPRLRPREAPQPQPNLRLFEALAEATGGALKPELASPSPPLGPAEQLPLWPYLIPLAMSLYLVELVMRRLAG